MRTKIPDKKDALSMIESAKKKMDFTLSLEVNELSGSTILPNIYECFRILGDAILVSKGIVSEDHIMPINEVSALRINSDRPIAAVSNLGYIRRKINYYGYDPKIIEVQDAITLAKSCFYKAYNEIKRQLMQ